MNWQGRQRRIRNHEEGKMEKERNHEKNVAIKIEHVSKWFGKRKVVDDLCLETYEGRSLDSLSERGRQNDYY